MNKLEVDDRHYLLSRFTPWDTRVFGFKTNEIVEIHYQDIDKLHALIRSLDAYNKEHGIKLTFTRIDARDKIIKHVLQEHSFYYAETSFSVRMKDIANHDFGARFRSNLPLTVPDAGDFNEIRMIARSSFNYSRFHEDYLIDEEKARDRYFYWIDDLIAQGRSCLLYKADNVVKSFLFYTIEGDCVDLILAGSKKGSEMLSYSFWPSFMAYFQKQGLKKAKTVISASNVGIVNLYAQLQFKFETTMIGFHKMY